jgi:primary-amine oxidase
MTAPPLTAAHPLDPLTADEIEQAVRIAREGFGEAVVVTAFLDEPSRTELRTGGPPQRRAVVVLYDGSTVQEVLVAGDRRLVVRPVPGVVPPIGRAELEAAADAVKADPRWIAALHARGVIDLEHVIVQPWPPGQAEPPGRRLAKALTFVGTRPGDNIYARPVEGLLATVDLDTAEVLAVEDDGVVAIPPTAGDYYERTPERDDLKPLEIIQPEGPSFTLDGHALRWLNWSLHVGFTPREGIVLHQLAWDGRPILHRASLSEMWVPYGDPALVHRIKQVFDEGEAGLGSLANPLQLGCDCLGEIRYLDAVHAEQDGTAVTIPNAICIHEEDTGVAWKHTDFYTDAVEVRRGRRLVISSFSTVGNYDYGFFWYLHTDGTIAFEVKLTGILSTGASENATDYGGFVAPGLVGPNHQHVFNVRLDVGVDGDENTVVEVDGAADPPGPGNPAGNAWRARETPLTDELGARRRTDSASGRTWLIANERVHNAFGRPVAFQLAPGPSPLPLSVPGSPARARAGFAEHHLWVTAFDPAQRHAAGEYPYAHAGDGLPAYAAGNRPVRDADIVVWHTFAAHHVTRPEDWPVMPVTTAGFHLRPFGFFTANPALDLPRPVHRHHH